MDLDHVPANTKSGLLAMQYLEGNSKLAHLGTSEQTATLVLNRYIAGESIIHIASTLKVSSERLYMLMLDQCPDDWRKAQAGKSLKMLEECEMQLEGAEDGVGIGRARERGRLACWRLEKVARREYGQDAPAVQINVNLGDVGERIRELERELLGNAAALSVDNSSGADSG